MKKIYKPKMWVTIKVQEYPPAPASEKNNFISIALYDEKKESTEFNEAILFVINCLKEANVNPGKKSHKSVMLKIKEYYADTRMTGKQKTIFVNTELHYYEIANIISEKLDK